MASKTNIVMTNVKSVKDVLARILSEIEKKNIRFVMTSEREIAIIQKMPNDTLLRVDFSFDSNSNEIYICFHDVIYSGLIAKKLIKNIKSIHVFHFSGYAPESNDDPDLLSHKDYISSVTHFPKIEVQKYGRDKLLSAPCELIEEWEDGSIFMMIRKASFASSFVEREKLRKYIGEVAK